LLSDCCQKKKNSGTNTLELHYKGLELYRGPSILFGMPKGGLEPPCPFEHNALNVACLPISPLRLEAYDTVSFVVCQYLSGMVIHYCREACYNYSDFLNILESGSFYA
jgi:hypothetical protein